SRTSSPSSTCRPPSTRTGACSRCCGGWGAEEVAMKQLWIILGSVVTVAVLTFGTFNVVSLLAHEEEDVSQVVAAAGIDLIDVAVDNGSIEVTGGDVDEVTLEARI